MCAIYKNYIYIYMKLNWFEKINQKVVFYLGFEFVYEEERLNLEQCLQGKHTNEMQDKILYLICLNETIGIGTAGFLFGLMIWIQKGMLGIGAVISL